MLVREDWRQSVTVFCSRPHPEASVNNLYLKLWPYGGGDSKIIYKIPFVCWIKQWNQTSLNISIVNQLRENYKCRRHHTCTCSYASWRWEPHSSPWPQPNENGLPCRSCWRPHPPSCHTALSQSLSQLWVSPQSQPTHQPLSPLNQSLAICSLVWPGNK